MSRCRHCKKEILDTQDWMEWENKPFHMDCYLGDMTDEIKKIIREDRKKFDKSRESS